MDNKERQILSQIEYPKKDFIVADHSTKAFAVLCGGGPAPGYMGVIYGACRAALDHGWLCLGFLDGWKGVLNRSLIEITEEKLYNRSYWENGTIIGTSRTKLKNDEVRGNQFQIAANNIKTKGIDALLVLGGEDTISIGDILFREYHCPILAAPKTVDWDVCATERTFGADTAINHAAKALRGIKYDAQATHYVMVVEHMGRNCGRPTIHAGLAGGAHVILIPEFVIPFEDVVEQVKRAHRKFGYAIVSVAEELSYENFGLEDKGTRDEFGHIEIAKRDKGWAKMIAEELQRHSGLTCRSVVLGHAQRGGPATALDTVMTLRMGLAAFEHAARGEFGKLMAWKGEQVLPVDLSLAGKGQTKPVTEEEYLECLRLIYQK